MGLILLFKLDLVGYILVQTRLSMVKYVCICTHLTLCSTNAVSKPSLLNEALIPHQS